MSKKEQLEKEISSLEAEMERLELFGEGGGHEWTSRYNQWSDLTNQLLEELQRLIEEERNCLYRPPTAAECPDR